MLRSHYTNTASWIITSPPTLNEGWGGLAFFKKYSYSWIKELGGLTELSWTSSVFRGVEVPGFLFYHGWELLLFWCCAWRKTGFMGCFYFSIWFSWVFPGSWPSTPMSGCLQGCRSGSIFSGRTRSYLINHPFFSSMCWFRPSFLRFFSWWFVSRCEGRGQSSPHLFSVCRKRSCCWCRFFFNWYSSISREAWSFWHTASKKASDRIIFILCSVSSWYSSRITVCGSRACERDEFTNVLNLFFEGAFPF